MNRHEKRALLQMNIEIVTKHFQPIERAMQVLDPLFPFTVEKVKALTAEETNYHDVLIYRFNLLYDALSLRVLPLFVDVIYEQPDGPDFSDILKLLKRLKFVDVLCEWKKIHSLRRRLYHYTFDSVKQSEYLNELCDLVPVLVSTFELIKKRLAREIA